MRISILTLFPELFSGPFSTSILKRAQKRHLVSIEFVNIRAFSRDSCKSVDDHPFGGGVGMILRVDVIDRALQSVTTNSKEKTSRIILLDPQGKQYTQHYARTVSTIDHLILICGHYEGVDERIRTLVDDELSIGDYILTGGEIPAMVVVDSVVRLIPHVLKKEATQNESFEHNLLECPQYTKPAVYKRKRVPSVLVSGNHAKITQWRLRHAIHKTKKRRPDLLMEQTDSLSPSQ